MLRFSFSAAVMTCLVTVSNAQRYCDRPRDPSCIILMMGGNRTEFEGCRLQMMNFQDRVREYVACLDGEQKDAIQQLNDSIRRFNACASGVTC